MQLDGNDKQLLEILNRSIRDMERVEDDPATMTFIARRVGNIVKHMKDLREDLRPRSSLQGIAIGNSVRTGKLRFASRENETIG